MSLELLGRIITNFSLATLVVFLHYVAHEKLGSVNGNTRKVVLGIGFAAAAVLSMLFAVPVSDGVIFDSKMMLGVLAGFYGGWLPGLILSVAAVSMRIVIGGVGVFGGSLGVLLSVAAGLSVGRYVQGHPSLARPIVLLGLGFTAAFLQVLLGFTLLLYVEPQQTLLAVEGLLWPTLALYPPVTVLIGLMFGFVDDRSAAHEHLRRAQDQLENLNARLAERVADRTQELEQANSDLRTTVAELRRTQDELVNSRKMASLGRLMAGIAHELNSPLAAVSGANRVVNETLAARLPEAIDLVSSLSPAEFQSFRCLLHRALQAPALEEGLLTRRERRAAVEATAQELDEGHRWAAETVREFHLLECSEELSRALDSKHANEILSAISRLGAAMRSSVLVALGAEKAARTVRALHNYAHQNHAAEPEQINLAQEIETVLELLHSETHRGVQVKKAFDREISIFGMRDPLNQVWMNLIKNALHAMEYRGTLSVAVYPTTNPAQVCVAVGDTGCGIPDSIRPQLFDPFFTTKEDGEGIGIGLDICKRIVERHGGRIEYESGEAGTSFFVYLPILSVQASGVPLQAANGERQKQ